MYSYIHPEASIIDEHSSGLIVLNKPINILSHPNDKNISEKALIHAPYDDTQDAYLLKHEKLYLLHRLDAPTSGIILLAKNVKLAQYMRHAFETHAIRKTYHAVVHGVPLRTPALWKDTLKTQYKNNQLRTEKGSGTLAQTKQTLIKKNLQFPISLLKLQPITGLTHQLRVQCALHHVPIVGDKTYGHFAKNKAFTLKTHEKRLFLHASGIEFNLPHQIPYQITLPLPDAFTQYFE